MIRPARLLKSFRYAWRGILTVAREEQNFRVQLTAAVGVFALAWYVRARPVEMAVLVLVSALVLVLELVNSVTERVVDTLKPRLHPFVGEVKNIAAGAVLVASVGAVLVAVLIFFPYFT